MTAYRCLTAILVLLFSASARGTESGRPNIVIFLSDDMGWGQLGYQGGKAVPTPNIDRIAKEGIHLTEFYVQCVCTPTRSGLLTGRYPFRTGTEERFHGNDTAGLLTDERTLANGLKDAGYATAVIGKWHLGEWQKKHLPMQRGFDHQFGFYSAVNDSFTHTRGNAYDWHRDEQPLQESRYTTWAIADEFTRLLGDQKADQPFFYYVPFNAVHGPHDAPPEYVAKYKGNKQLAMLECMDIGVGRMLDALAKKGVLDKTLVIFFNDNGGPGRIVNTPYRGGKTETYEGGVRVACAMRLPGQLPAGKAVGGMVHVVDLYPTLMKLAGGSLQQALPLDGIDQWSTLARGEPSPRHEVVHSVPGLEASETGVPSIRIDDFKLVGEELYNIRVDPYEKADIAAANPDQVEKLKARLTALATERRTPEPHNKTPDHAVIRGEQENVQPAPDWLKKAAEAGPDERNTTRTDRKKKKGQSEDE